MDHHVSILRAWTNRNEKVRFVLLRNSFQWKNRNFKLCLCGDLGCTFPTIYEHLYPKDRPVWIKLLPLNWPLESETRTQLRKNRLFRFLRWIALFEQVPLSADKTRSRLLCVSCVFFGLIYMTITVIESHIRERERGKKPK